ncbi:hypothetical protein CLIB1444_10S03972 [[Candida] jaroonii]|uniref:Uncharacterized protein n=1 Tax=[Candida] jaroonii TaxID=467808 RepID=A0ACA9YDZ8_9ASCO|nr:hypothetical protein CLIB1444_10S03972 [[Candida] jaroonii]
MIVKLKYKNPKKVRLSNVELLENVDFNDEDWLLRMKEMNERLNLLKESYKLINSLRKGKKVLDQTESESEVSGAETPKRSRRSAN